MQVQGLRVACSGVPSVPAQPRPETQPVRLIYLFTTVTGFRSRHPSAVTTTVLCVMVYGTRNIETYLKNVRWAVRSFNTVSCVIFILRLVSLRSCEVDDIETLAAWGLNGNLAKVWATGPLFGDDSLVGHTMFRHHTRSPRRGGLGWFGTNLCCRLPTGFSGGWF